MFKDCRSIGVGNVIDGMAGDMYSDRGSPLLAGGTAGVAELDSAAGGDCALSCPLSRFKPILTVPSTITTTLAPTSSARILEDTFDSPTVVALAALRAASFSAVTRLGFAADVAAGAAAAACAARRAA